MKTLLLVSASALAFSTAARADTVLTAADTVSQAVVTAPHATLDLSAPPTTAASVTAQTIARTINVLTPEDTLRYLPNVLIRQRHIGDTQSPITSRTSLSRPAKACGDRQDERFDRICWLGRRVGHYARHDCGSIEPHQDLGLANLDLLDQGSHAFAQRE